MFATKFFFIIHLCLCVVPIIFATDQQIPLCSCSQASTCASEGSSQVENCKKECANYLAIYAAKEKADAEPLTGCFWMKSGLEGERMTKCMGAKIDNFCAASNSSNATLAKPDYCQWMESISNSTSAEDSAKSGGVFIRKARSAFIVFRSFQKCMNNCAKRHSTNCFNQAGCAVSLHSDQAKSLSIYNECTLQKVHKDAREACRCLIQKHKVYQLVGICPLMSNTYLMRMA